MAAYSRSLSKTRLLFYHRKELFSTTAIQNKQKQQLEDNRNQQNKMNSEDKFGLDLVKKVYELVMKERLLSGHYDKKSKVVEFVPPEELEKCLGKANRYFKKINLNIVYIFFSIFRKMFRWFKY